MLILRRALEERQVLYAIKKRVFTQGFSKVVLPRASGARRVKLLSFLGGGGTPKTKKYKKKKNKKGKEKQKRKKKGG